MNQIYIFHIYISHTLPIICHLLKKTHEFIFIFKGWQCIVTFSKISMQEGGKSFPCCIFFVLSILISFIPIVDLPVVAKSSRCCMVTSLTWSLFSRRSYITVSWNIKRNELMKNTLQQRACLHEQAINAHRGILDMVVWIFNTFDSDLETKNDFILASHMWKLQVTWSLIVVTLSPFLFPLGQQHLVPFTNG